MLENVRPQLLAALADDGSEEAFWARVGRTGTPTVEAIPGGRCRVTFLWRETGSDAEGGIERVYMDVNSVTNHHAAVLPVMERLPGTGIWFWAVEVSGEWRGSYSYIPATADLVREVDPPEAGLQDTSRRARWIALLQHARHDPFNPVRAGLKSGLAMPGAPLQRWWDDPAPTSVTAGNTHELPWDSGLLGRTRTVWVHETPHDADTDKADRPLVILLDGQHWVHQMPAARVFDAAVAEGELPAAVIVAIDVLNGAVRSEELPCNSTFWDAILTELLPLVETVAAFTKNPRRTVVAGQSFGGLAALFAALEHPERFGLVASQSGSFWWPVPYTSPVPGSPGGDIAERIARTTFEHPPVVRLQAGLHEGDMVLHSRTVHERLIAAGVESSFEVFDGGHDWLCWRGGLVDSTIDLLNTASVPTGTPRPEPVRA
ncbi:enterochelin esterase [Paenarthrobacter sp. NPDC090520]|uniref:enterochelin esterase n=1 Tax=Paenarthrobacter sp. NPDC090520 TaxID=3364382 RepID=UPI00382E3836